MLNPAAFGGGEAFDRQTSFIAEAARASPPVADGTGGAVRTPGQAALAHKAECLRSGVALYGDVMDKLVAKAEELGVAERPVDA